MNIMIIKINKKFYNPFSFKKYSCTFLIYSKLIKTQLKFSFNVVTALKLRLLDELDRKVRFYLKHHEINTSNYKIAEQALD